MKTKSKVSQAKAIPKALLSRHWYEVIVVDDGMEDPHTTRVTKVSFIEAERAVSVCKAVFGDDTIRQLLVVPMMADGSSQFGGCDVFSRGD